MREMMETLTDPALQSIPVSLRNLQSAAFQHPQHSLPPQLASEYDHTGFHSYRLNDAQHLHGQDEAFGQQPRQSFQTPPRYPNASFSVLNPDQQQQQQQQQQHQQPQLISLQANQDDSPAKEIGGHFGGMKAIASPADLRQWREKLFNVNEMITLTEDE
jgi:hypothetical protein